MLDFFVISEFCELKREWKGDGGCWNETGRIRTLMGWLVDLVVWLVFFLWLVVSCCFLGGL